MKIRKPLVVVMLTKKQRKFFKHIAILLLIVCFISVNTAPANACAPAITAGAAGGAITLAALPVAPIVLVAGAAVAAGVTIWEIKKAGDSMGLESYESDIKDGENAGDSNKFKNDDPIPMAIKLLGTERILREASTRGIKPLEGVTDGVIHGNFRTFAVKSGQKWIEVTPRQLAKYIKSPGNEYTGKPVRLISCYAGRASQYRAQPLAQDLANKLGVQVRAADTKVWVMRDGTLRLGESWQNPSGGIWIDFFPGKH